jgi:hypothetical protein
MKANLFIIFVLLFVLACDDDSPKDSSQKTVVATITSGSWRITSFVDSGTDETSNFTGYTFTFAELNSGAVSGGVTAVKGANTYTGGWNITDNNSDDDTLNDLNFFLNFATPADFTDLNEDWDIIELTDIQLKLQHISGGNGGTDLLTFQKN